MASQKEINGASGALEIVTDQGDFILNLAPATLNESGSILRVRLPGAGGGKLEKTYAGIATQFSEMPRVLSDKLYRNRKPLVLLGDDSGDGSFSYLQIQSDAEGFTLTSSLVNSRHRSSDSVRFTDEESVRFLSQFYAGILGDQKEMQRYVGESLRCQTGPIYQRLLNSETEKGVGLFLLTLGVAFPQEIGKEWMAKYGTLPEVMALTNAIKYS